MRLEALYPGARSASIADLVPECGDSFSDVTIEHALDMTTGHFESPDLHGDEDAALNSQFFAGDHSVKIDVACNGFPRKADPGTHLTYHTWDTYLAGTAMNAVLRRERGPSADYFDDLLVTDIWRPLGLSRVAAATRRTYDEVRQPYTGFGLTLLRNDMARLAQFIGRDDGRLGDVELLDRSLFDAIKQRIPGDTGMVAELESIRYNNGFRSFDVSSYIDCEDPVWVVVLSGFGGIIVAIMPNDTAYYYFSDGNVHRYLSAVRESHRIRPMCTDAGQPGAAL
jgi:CubicO group peptidase (beta-lactamase class C family)